MAKHTPGPWGYKRCNIGHPDNRKNPIVTGSPVEYGRGNYICRLHCKESTIAGMTNLAPDTLEEAEANARLIADLPVIERAESDPEVWSKLTEGLGITTANGLRHGAPHDW